MIGMTFTGKSVASRIRIIEMFSRTRTQDCLRFLSRQTVKVPNLADSITEGTLGSWERNLGDMVKADETVAMIETDKVTIPVNSPCDAKLVEQHAQVGDTIAVGSDLFTLDIGGDETPAIATSESSLKKHNDKIQPKASSPTDKNHLNAKLGIGNESSKVSGIPVLEEWREPLSRMRLRIAERMKEAQNTAASLTTFNEIDMTTLMEKRKKFGENFLQKSGIKLGLLSPFIKASVNIINTDLPVINARIDMETKEIVYKKDVDVSIAVATPKGLVTPVFRQSQLMNLAQIEQWIKTISDKARAGLIELKEISGGSFTISNGGIFGSLMGTPILNPPQSAVLGMHAIKKRPVYVESTNQIEARPMMYVALTYDHRLIDGREAVTFLVKLKEVLEDPSSFVYQDL